MRVVVLMAVVTLCVVLFMVVSLLILRETVACVDCGIRVAHVADCGIGVAEVSDGGCSAEGSSSMDDAPEVTRDHAVEGVNGSIGVAHGADCGWISNLERKRGQYQDYGFVRAKRQRNVASKRKYLRNV